MSAPPGLATAAVIDSALLDPDPVDNCFSIGVLVNVGDVAASRDGAASLLTEASDPEDDCLANAADDDCESALPRRAPPAVLVDAELPPSRRRYW